MTPNMFYVIIYLFVISKSVTSLIPYTPWLLSEKISRCGPRKMVHFAVSRVIIWNLNIQNLMMKTHLTESRPQVVTCAWIIHQARATISCDRHPPKKTVFSNKICCSSSANMKPEWPIPVNDFIINLGNFPAFAKIWYRLTLISQSWDVKKLQMKWPSGNVGKQQRRSTDYYLIIMF